MQQKFIKKNKTNYKQIIQRFSKYQKADIFGKV